MKMNLVICGILITVVACQSNAQITNQSLSSEHQVETASNLVSHIVLLGDETHVSAIKADPRGYMDKPLVIAGGVRIHNYYNYNYNEATQTHFSLAFAELTADTRKIGSLYIYASRSFAQPLIDEVLKNEANGFDCWGTIKLRSQLYRSLYFGRQLTDKS